jgi:hypothetical protein
VAGRRGHGSNQSRLKLDGALACAGPAFVDFDRVYDPDDSRVNGTVLAAKCHSGRAALDDEHDFPKAGAYGVDGDHVALFVFAVDSNRPDDQKLSAVEPLVFASSDDRANYPP